MQATSSMSVAVNLDSRLSSTLASTAATLSGAYTAAAGDLNLSINEVDLDTISLLGTETIDNETSQTLTGMPLIKLYAYDGNWWIG